MRGGWIEIIVGLNGGGLEQMVPPHAGWVD